jgi:hypothetical protein
MDPLSKANNIAGIINCMLSAIMLGLMIWQMVWQMRHTEPMKASKARRKRKRTVIRPMAEQALSTPHQTHKHLPRVDWRKVTQAVDAAVSEAYPLPVNHLDAIALYSPYKVMA